MSDAFRPLSPPIDHERVRKVEILISNLLRIGVFTSLLLVITGTVVSFIHHPDYIASRDDLSRLTKPGAAVFPRTPGEMVKGIAHFRGQAIVVLGLLLLVATPVMRVAVSILAFIHQRDWIFVAITSVVLCLLILSFFLGKAGG